ncbi:MAG: transposase [Octadecabacter sp.]
MSNYRRPKQNGACVFFTVNLADRSSGLLVREIAILRQAVAKTRVERPFKINAWVVLPNHMHCVWTLPEGDADFSTRMGAIKARFSMGVRRAGFTPQRVPISAQGLQVMSNGGVNPALRKGQVGIWQKRFWEHHIRNEADYAAHVNYCWFNPVKHGLVKEPADWPYSSYHRDNP